MFKKKEKPDKNINDNRKVLPIRNYDEVINAYVLEDGSYFDILEKVPQDVENSLIDEVQFEILIQTKFYKLYRNDIKILAMNFPVSTKTQRRYLQKRLEQTNDRVKKLWLKRSVEELEEIDKNCTRREYYIFIFSGDKDNHIKNLKQVIGLFGITGNKDIVKEISSEKKHRIVRKLCNMNMLISGEDYDV